MEQNYLGYLLNALDDDERDAVARHVRENPEEERKLTLLRQAVEPLAADAEPPQPPADLVIRTLALVAEARCRELPRAPVEAVKMSPWSFRSWRRIDVLVAAGLLLAVGSVVFPLGSRLTHRARVLACQENLRQLHGALVGYSELHDGQFPYLDPEHPRKNFAGMYVAQLNEHGLLNNLSVNCPANGQRPAPQLLGADLVDLPDEQFEQTAKSLGGCYAYSLGYRDDNGRYVGLRRGEDDGQLPIMADKPPPVGLGNSPNHGGQGQNVLFVDGHILYTPSRSAGRLGDDIYVNKMNKVAAGVDRWDSVLGVSNARP
jgi:prepilin-type processing-associated H-X9-DG protein